MTNPTSMPNNLTATAGWDNVPQFETNTPLLGGPGAEMNAQAQALADRTEYLKARHVADYTALRALTADVKSVYVTGYLATSAPSGIAGEFTRDDSDTTSADNGGTIIVASNGKRWKRVYSGAVNVMWFSAANDRSADATAAFLVAKTAAGARGRVHAPAGSYNVTTLDFGNVSNFTLSGDGPGATCLYPQSTGTAADACVKFNSTNGNLVRVEGLAIVGNGLTGTAGNGHGIALINAAGTGFAPQLVALRDVYIEGCRGSARDHAGAAMTACAIYGYLNTAVHFENISTYSSSVGLYLEGVQKAFVYNHVADTIDNRGVHLVNSENIDFFGGILNRCGSGGATDGAVVRQGTSNVNFYGTRLKDANPTIDNSRSTTFLNRDTTYFGADFNQLTAGYNLMCDIGTGDSGFRIKGGRFKWASAVTAAIGVNVGDGPGGYQMTGLCIEDVACQIGSGGTITALAKIANTVGVVQAPRFRGLQYGDGSAAAVPTTMTNGILLSGIIDSPIIEAPNFHASTNTTITNCVNINASGGNIINAVIIAPVYRTTNSGVITNQLVNSTGATVTQIAGGVVSSGNATLKPAASVTPANNGEMTFQLTSNTQMAIKVKGSDGVVRSTALTLA